MQKANLVVDTISPFSCILYTEKIFKISIPFFMRLSTTIQVVWLTPFCSSNIVRFRTFCLNLLTFIDPTETVH